MPPPPPITDSSKSACQIGLSVVSNRVAMLGRDEQTQPGFVDFQNFVQGFGFASREAIFWPGSFKKPTRWEFARAVTQRW